MSLCHLSLALCLIATATATPALHNRAQASSTTSTSAESAEPTPYIDPDTIGTFNVSQMNPNLPANSAFLTRQEDELLPNRTVQLRHGDALRPLHPGTPLNVSAIVNGSAANVDEYMHRFGITGLTVVQDGKLHMEQYRLGSSPAAMNVIQSCTKAVVSTALGLAIADGSIATSDLVSKWIPELAGSTYGDCPLQNIIDMTSGVAPPSDAPDYFDVYMSTDPLAVLDLFRTYERVAAPGKVFNYIDQNYFVASLSIQRAVGCRIEEYINKHIYAPAGMQYDAYMRRTAAGQVDGHGGLAISLADMTRFGLFVLDTFQTHRGPRVLDKWFEDIAGATTATGIRAPGNIDVVPQFGYQAGWWTLPRSNDSYLLGNDRAFAALGTYNQAIYVIPDLDAVVAIQSSYPVHYGDLFVYGQEFVTAVALALKEL
ncbi:hypothetical protein Q7P37_010386 [Cladosporium fusiforme]